MLDKVLSRYNDVNYFMNLDYMTGIELLYKMDEKELEERAWEKWLIEYPHMTKENFIPFSKYLENLKAPKIIETKTNEEIIKEIENARLVHQGKHKGVVNK